MKQGDIYFVSLDPTMGHEQRGWRPVFVLTSESFNRLTNAAVVAPITTGGEFARRNGFAVDLSGRGMKTSGIVRCDQPRTVDLRARNARFVESADKFLIGEVLATVAAILELGELGTQ